MCCSFGRDSQKLPDPEESGATFRKPAARPGISDNKERKHEEIQTVSLPYSNLRWTGTVVNLLSGIPSYFT
jgi:hypothetical protein